MSNQEEIDKLERQVQDICALMRGPMSNIERAFLHEDRKELRAQIAQLKTE